jgi:hypothetical protein
MQDIDAAYKLDISRLTERESHIPKATLLTLQDATRVYWQHIRTGEPLSELEFHSIYRQSVGYWYNFALLPCGRYLHKDHWGQLTDPFGEA